MRLRLGMVVNEPAADDIESAAVCCKGTTVIPVIIREQAVPDDEFAEVIYQNSSAPPHLPRKARHLPPSNIQTGNGRILMYHFLHPYS